MATTRLFKLFKTWDVEGDLAPYRIVTFADTAWFVAQASDPAETLIGTTDELGRQSNGRADIAMSAQPEVEAGGAVAFGDALTSDAQGRAVKATATGQHIIGFALKAAQAAGDVIDYIYALCLFAAVVEKEEAATPPSQEGDN